MARSVFLLAGILAASACGCGSSSSSGDGINDSPECQEFCNKASQCPNASCTSMSCAAHDGDLCPAGTLARLKCEAETGNWQCLKGGWAVSYSCTSAITAACGAADSGADTTPDVSDTASDD